MIAVKFPFGPEKGSVAVIQEYQWASMNKQLEKALNLMLDPDGPGGEVPYPDLQAAQAAVEMYRGKIIKQELREYPPTNAVL